MMWWWSKEACEDILVCVLAWPIKASRIKMQIKAEDCKWIILKTPPPPPPVYLSSAVNRFHLCYFLICISLRLAYVTQ